MTERQLERQVERIKKRIQKYESREESLSKHGHWSLGYYKGKLSIMEDWLDEMKEGKTKTLICQWCFEEPALKGKTVCQACSDSFIEQQEEYPSFNLDDFLEESEDKD